MGLQAQTLFINYGRNKYDRLAKSIWSNFYTLDNVGIIYAKRPPSLFVINTSDKKYHYNQYKKEILKLISIFPNKTKYELNDENEEQIIKFLKEGNNNGTFLLEFIKIKKKKNVFNSLYFWYFIFIIFIIIMIIFIFNYLCKRFIFKFDNPFNNLSEVN